MTSLTEKRSEKYAKKLIGRTEMEDALKRLDKLTQEEARMAAAQNLKATHTVDERVKGVVDTVEAIDNKVADVDGRVAGVSEQVTGVDDRVASVKEKVVTIDDRVKDIAGDVDEMRRASSNLTSADYVTLLILREPTTGKHSQMALATGPLDEPQYRMWYSSQENCHVVFSRQDLSGVEGNWLASLGPRKTFARSSFQADSL
jgi:chromosome segregation ATPase